MEATRHSAIRVVKMFDVVDEGPMLDRIPDPCERSRCRWQTHLICVVYERSPFYFSAIGFCCFLFSLRSGHRHELIM